MPFAPLALGIGALLGGASSVGGAISGGSMNRKNRKWQEKMYNKQVADNRENAAQQWAAQRDYAKWSYDQFESPSAQRAAMAAAGINPFVEGSVMQPMGATQGGGSAADSASLPSDGPYKNNPLSNIQAGASSIMQGAAQAQSIKQSDAQIELMNAQRIKTLAEARGVENTNSLFDFVKSAAESDALSKRFRAKVDEVSAAFAEAQAVTSLEERNAKIASLWAQYEKDLSQAAKTDADRLTVDTLRDLQAKALEAGIGLTEAQTETEGAKQSNLAAQTKTEDDLRDSRVFLTDSQAKELLSRAGLNEITRDRDLYDQFLRLTNTPNANSVAGILSGISSFIKSRLDRDLRDYQRAALSDYLEKIWSGKKP